MPVIRYMLFTLILAGHVEPEMFTSMEAIGDLAKHQDRLAKWALDSAKHDKKRLRQLDQQINSATKWLAEEKNSARAWTDDAYGYVEHPIAALHVIALWIRIQEMAGPGFRPPQFPNTTDYQGGIAALVRLQRTYKIPTEDLAAGVVADVSAAHGLNPRDVYMMGLAWAFSDHEMALSWFQLISDRDLEKINKDQYQKMMAEIFMRSDLRRDKRNAKQRALENRKVVGDLDELRKQLMFSNTKKRQRDFWKEPVDYTMGHYEALCRGDRVKNTIFVNKDLMCIYRQGILPYIQYKEEIHSFDPRISLFYDVISDSQSQMMKKKAFREQLYPAFVGNPSKLKISNARIGQLAWLMDSDRDIENISVLVSDITGLDAKTADIQSSSEYFQVVNYGLAGQYEPHFDYYEDPAMLERLPEYIMGNGDRMSTFMYYLNEVKAGGATVFPNIGVRIPPIKNAAAFWYNMRLSGDKDKRTLHAGCPVLFGQKWVSNKWTREGGQVFHRPCALTPDATDPVWR